MSWVRYSFFCFVLFCFWDGKCLLFSFPCFTLDPQTLFIFFFFTLQYCIGFAIPQFKDKRLKQKLYVSLAYKTKKDKDQKKEGEEESHCGLRKKWPGHSTLPPLRCNHWPCLLVWIRDVQCSFHQHQGAMKFCLRALEFTLIVNYFWDNN